LNPDESWEEELKEIQPLDLEHAEAVCTWLAAGHDAVWLRRHWSGWPGNKTWLSWKQHPRVKEMIRLALEQVSEQRQEAAEQELNATFEEVKNGVYSDKLASAVMNGARYRAEYAIKMAQARSPERYSPHLQVTQTVQGRIDHVRSDGTQHLVEAILATHDPERARPLVIEGEAEARLSAMVRCRSCAAPRGR
jgi:hypothetical protein